MEWFKVPEINRRTQVLILVLVIMAIPSYFMRERYVNAGAAKCGCSKCHTIELNGCEGCHNSQQGKPESYDPVSRSEDPHEDSTNSENDPEPHKQQSSSTDTHISEPAESKNEELRKSETVPNKSKNQQGLDQP